MLHKKIVYLCNVDPQPMNNFALEKNLQCSLDPCGLTLHKEIVCAQGNSLCNVGPWLTDNLSYQNNLYNVVSIKLGQHCLGISNIQCWLWLEQHNLFKSYRNSLNKIARLSKDNKNKLNKVWVGIKEIININKKTPYKLGTLTIMKSW